MARWRWRRWVFWTIVWPLAVCAWIVLLLNDFVWWLDRPIRRLEDWSER